MREIMYIKDDICYAGEFHNVEGGRVNMEARERGTLIASWVNTLAGLARRTMGRQHPGRGKRGEVRYWKPNMTNLPYKLGKEIFEEILNSPPPDYAKMRKESALLVQEMLKERKLDNA